MNEIILRLQFVSQRFTFYGWSWPVIPQRSIRTCSNKGTAYKTKRDERDGKKMAEFIVKNTEGVSQIMVLR